MRSARFATSNLVTPFIAAALSAASALACQPQEAKAPEAAASAPTESAPSESAPTTEAPAAPTDANEAEKQAARSGAETWLALVDQSQYGQSWEAAAPMFQSAVTKEQWEGAAKGARGPLGALASRKFNAADYKQSLPGAPDGEYVLVVYDTSFAQKAAATERVTLVRTPEGTWKVVGYFIQ